MNGMKVQIRVYRSRRVECSARVKLPMSTGRAWGQLRDFARTAGDDHFHESIVIDGGVPRAGASIHIRHQYFCCIVHRIGRIVRWTEAKGFAFSDLSRRGPRKGFPHVMSITLLSEQDGAGSTMLIRITGRWTAPTPRWMARVWLWWVTLSIAVRLQNKLWMFERMARSFEKRVPI